MSRHETIAEIEDLLPPLTAADLVRGLPLVTPGPRRETCVVKCRHQTGGWRDDRGRHLLDSTLRSLVIDVSEPLGYVFAAGRVLRGAYDLEVESEIGFVLEAPVGVSEQALVVLRDALADASQPASS